MRRLTSIVASNLQGVIGAENALPWRIKSDLKFFKEQTAGNIVIMGRKTHDSLGRPLSNRYNVVVSHQLKLFEDRENCVLQYGIFEALKAAEAAPSRYKEIFIIGGSSMYEQFKDIVDRYLITLVHKPVPNGDAFFDPRIMGKFEDWETRPLSSGSANNEGDEASFEVFELTPRDIDDRHRKRLQGLELLEERIRTGVSRSRSQRPANQFVAGGQLSLV